MENKMPAYTDQLSFYKVRRSIIYSFGLATVFAVVLVVCIDFFIDDREDDAKLINMAGRQRMLSQKIIKNLYAAQVGDTNYGQLRKDARLWDSIHNMLLHGNGDITIKKKYGNPEVEHLLEKITPYQRELYRLTEQGNPGELLEGGLSHARAMEEGFLIGMDQLLEVLQADAEKGIRNLKYIVSFLVALFMAFIVGLYEFFVKPIIKSVRALSKEKEKQARRTHSILENTPNPIWSVDLDYRLMAHNTAFSERMSEEAGKVPKIGESVLGRNTIRRKKLYDRAFSGESFQCELEIKKQGHTAYHELSLNPIYESSGKVTGCSVYRIDATHRVSILHELQKSEANLKEAQGIANMGNWNWNIVLNKIDWSDNLYRIFGQDPETFQADLEGLMKIIHPDDRELFYNDVEGAIENQRIHDIVHRIVLEDGSIRHIHQMGKVFNNAEGKPVRMAGTSQDVTVLENAKERVMKQYDDLQNFVYIVSHNVRAPIATLQGLVEIFELGNGGGRNEEITAHIGTTVNALDRTIKDLNHTLSLRKVSDDTFEEVDLAEILEDVKILLARDILESGATVECDFSGAPKLLGIKAYFANILFNLVSNAIDYRAKTRLPKIEVSSRTTSTGGVEITVRDNGRGMALSPEKYKKIFNMYGRLSGSSKGKGMGLYLVKTQVESMNGHIQAVSETDIGSVFTVLFDKGAGQGVIPPVRSSENR